MTDNGEDSDLQPLQMDLMARIGVALLQVQVTENALQLVTTFVLQKPNATAKQLVAQSEAVRKKTLGYFLTELRNRAELDEHFDSMLAEFLRRRNTLAHHLSEIPGWDTRTRSGIDAGRRFIIELMEINERVLLVLTGLVRAWQLQIGDAAAPPPPDHEFFEKVEAEYVPLVSSLFFAKKA